MIKKLIIPFILLFMCFFACSYDLKHITLDEKSDTAWTEIKKSNASDSSEYAQKLRDLKKLKDEGLLTDKEYEQKRKAIVDGM